jgi:hypothetical protein
MGFKKVQKNRPKNINIANIKKKPILPMLRYLYIVLSGKKEATIFEPSSGGIGKKLKIAKNMLILIAYINIELIMPKKVKVVPPSKEKLSPCASIISADIPDIKE